MLREYIKDVNGRIGINIGAQIIAKATNDPAEHGERNASGLVYCHDGDAVEVVVMVNDVALATIASFTAVAKAKNTMSAVHVRVRAYADVAVPKPPEKELEVDGKLIP